MLPKWDDKFSVHNSHIDAQHKQLFKLAGQAYALANKQITIEEIKALLMGFFDYMKKHFRDEEIYMEAIGYPDLERHHQIHRKIVQDLAGLIQETKNADDLKEKLAIIAKDWLLTHILQEDMKIEQYRRQSYKNGQAEEESSFEQTPQAEEIYHYVCNCPGKVHDVPYLVHKKIKNGASFRCRSCKTAIVFQKTL